MIDKKNKKVYEAFMDHYKKVHPCPWHEISEEELNDIYNFLINRMDVKDKYTFFYMMNYIIKRLSGLEDAHTEYEFVEPLPINFKIIENEILINYPERLKGSSLLAINDIDINKIVGELEEIITYGTEGRRRSKIEDYLFNRVALLSLPSLRGNNKVVYKIQKLDGEIEELEFDNVQKYKEEMFDTIEYLFGKPGEYEIKDGALIYKHSSVQPQFETRIKESIQRLRSEELSNVNKIIIDLRGNFGGNSQLNKGLMDFLRDNAGKELLVLTDYRVFSAGRYALMDLLKLGAITIGEEIGTPINCFGETNRIVVDNYSFASSSAYFYPGKGGFKTKEDFQEKVIDEVREPYIFKPDVYISTTKEDYINGIDTVLEYALSYNKNNLLRK